MRERLPAGDPIACPVCDSGPDRHRFLFKKQGVDFRACLTCRFEFVNPRPTEEWLKARYEYYGEHLFLDEHRLQTDFQAARFDVEWSVLQGLSGALLDVGCSTGAFVRLARNSGFDAQGIDLSERAVSYGRDHLSLPLRAGDFTAGMFAEASFDVVTLWATLEHLPDPGAFLAEASRVARPGGALLISVPNHRSLTQRILGPRNRYVGVDHLNYFSGRTLRTLVASHGFSPTLLVTRKVNPFLIYQDWRGKGAVGASVDQVIRDQSVTDAVKNGRLLAPMRAVHAAAERFLGRLGLGDLLLLRATKRT
jgi:2-polyprenyl-3-methyl-5-hydroxy-6-metoxy-1,4-benzoquinol methylase